MEKKIKIKKVRLQQIIKEEYARHTTLTEAFNSDPAFDALDDPSTITPEERLKDDLQTAMFSSAEQFLNKRYETKLAEYLFMSLEDMVVGAMESFQLPAPNPQIAPETPHPDGVDALDADHMAAAISEVLAEEGFGKGKK